MEMTTLSWNTFFIGCGILLVIAIWTTLTNKGKMLIEEHTPWNIAQWHRVLLVVGLTLFILVHPIFHLLAAAVTAGLYYLFVGSRLFKFNTKSKVKPGSLASSLFAESRNGADYLTVVCEGIEHDNPTVERRELDRCLFSFPYILPKPAVQVHYFAGKYEVQVALTRRAYQDSFVQYLEQAGFKIQLKNNN